MDKKQMQFGFVAVMDKQIAVDREVTEACWKRQNIIAIHRSHCRDLPRTDYENSVVPHNVRLAHHVIDFECEGCKLAYSDHTLKAKFGEDPTPGPRGGHVIKICLKDWYSKGHAKIRRPTIEVKTD